MNKGKRFSWARLLPALLLPPALSYLLFSWICQAKVAYKAEEKIGIFIGAKSYEEPLLKQTILEAEEGIKEIEVYSCDPKDPLFGTIVSAQGGYSCDLFLLPLPSFDPNLALTLCAPVGEEAVERAFGKQSLYALEGRNYGLLLNRGDDFLLDDFLTYEDEESDEYVLLFSASSVNLLGLKEKGETDHAVKAAGALLSYERKQGE